MALGQSFMPGGNGDDNGAANEAPLQTAIKLLSLRLPSFGGARTPLNASLLGGQGGSGLPPGMSADALQRFLFGQQMGPGPMPGGEPMFPTSPGGAGGGPGSVMPRPGMGGGGPRPPSFIVPNPAQEPAPRRPGPIRS